MNNYLIIIKTNYDKFNTTIIKTEKLDPKN